MMFYYKLVLYTFFFFEGKFFRNFLLVAFVVSFLFWCSVAPVGIPGRWSGRIREPRRRCGQETTFSPTSPAADYA